MKFDEIMDYYWDGFEEPFLRRVNRDAKLWRFPLWRVFDYFILGVKASVFRDYNRTFPNFKSWHDAKWSLRHGLSLLTRGV